MLEDSQSQPAKRCRPIARLSWINLLIVCSFTVVLTAIFPYLEPKTQNIEAVSVQPPIFIKKEYVSPVLTSLQENTLLPTSETFCIKKTEPVIIIRVIVTGYSSSVWETDETPYITAAGTSVRNGIVATNFLPFGTKIRIPEIYPDQVFIVEDRMHPRNSTNVDIWFPTYWEALDFGAKNTYIEI